LNVLESRIQHALALLLRNSHELVGEQTGRLVMPAPGAWILRGKLDRVLEAVERRITPGGNGLGTRLLVLVGENASVGAQYIGSCFRRRVGLVLVHQSHCPVRVANVLAWLEGPQIFNVFPPGWVQQEFNASQENRELLVIRSLGLAERGA